MTTRLVRPLRACLAAAVILSTSCSGSPLVPSVGPVGGRPAVLVGAGDIGVCGSQATEATASLLDDVQGTVFTAGDNAYPSGTAADYRQCYAPTWGRHRSRTRPTPGNHEYETAGATAYFDYFGANAGPYGLGYYSFNVGDWLVVSLNSNVDAGIASPQAEWLQTTLAESTSRCVAAIWHHPMFSSGTNGGDPRMRAMWRILQQYGAEIVINGHDHQYERFALLDADGRPDPNGIRSFIVGTGGATLTGPRTVRPGSEIRADIWGVLKLTLRSDSYEWVFLPIPGSPAFSDAGGGVCH